MCIRQRNLKLRAMNVSNSHFSARRTNLKVILLVREFQTVDRKQVFPSIVYRPGGKDIGGDYLLQSCYQFHVHSHR